MPNRVPWDDGYAVGDAALDARHRGLLAQCNRLADLCLRGDDGETARLFDAAVQQLRGLVREHFEAEATWLDAHGCPDLDDHLAECEEFEYLADEIATRENFDRLELQRFLALWCVGHVVGSADGLRALSAGGAAPG